MAVNDKNRFLKMAFALCLCFVAANSQAAIIPRLNQGQHLNIAAIGTSLTDSASSTWFADLGTWLNSKYPGQTTLDDEAVGFACSQTTSGTLTRSGLSPGLSTGGPGQLDLALANNPDAIFIEFAMNDADVNFAPSDPNQQPVGITPGMLRSNLQTMIDQINTWSSLNRAPGKPPVEIIIMTMNNDSTGVNGARPNLPAYYQADRDAAAANGLLLIDVNAAWVNLWNYGKYDAQTGQYVKIDPQTGVSYWTEYVPGGVHPNEQGTEAVIMPTVEGALLSQVPEPNAMVLLVTGLIFLAIFLVAYAWRKRQPIYDFWLMNSPRTVQR